VILGTPAWSSDKSVSDEVLNTIRLWDSPENDEDKVHIWPNPVTDVLNVKTLEDFKKVELLNMAGQIEEKREVKAEREISLSVTDSPRGLYLLRVTPVSGEPIISKVILK
jgi:hypothetical protein